MMFDQLISDTEHKMEKSLHVLQHEINKIRTGRAHTSLLEEIPVSCYGTEIPLMQAANISVLDARTLSITLWDKTLIPTVEKAIHHAALGLNPVVLGDLIRVPVPPLTEDRRKELIRVIRTEAEKARVSIRNCRRDANHACKEHLKEMRLSKDDLRHAENRIQKLTDRYIKEIESMLKQKEEETMEV